MKQTRDISIADIDFNTLADELRAHGLEGLNMDRVRRQSLKKRSEYEARHKTVLLGENQPVEFDNDDDYEDWEDDGTPIVITSGRTPPTTELDWYLRRYPPRLPDIRNQRKLTVPFGLLYYPTFCIGPAARQDKEYSIRKNGRRQYSRITTEPEGQTVFVPDLWTNTILYYLIYGYQNHFRESNDFRLEDDVLILPTINRIHSDLYRKKTGFDHPLLKHKIESALASLQHTSFYWQDFRGDKVDKPVRVKRILDYEILPPQGGRREIRPAVLFSEEFEGLLDTSDAATKGGFRQLSLDEILHCKTPTSRRLYEMTMMDVYGICYKKGLTMTFKQFADRFGLTASRRKRRAEVLASVNRVMDSVVSPITGVKFQYQDNQLKFELAELERITQHIDLGNPENWHETLLRNLSNDWDD